MDTLRTALVIFLTALVAGAETRVRITGLSGRSEAQILEEMGGRLAQVSTSAASPSRADDAAFLVRQVLRKDGYGEVQVDWKIISSTEIMLSVRAGQRLALGTVTITGVPTDEAKKLAKLFSRPAAKDQNFGSSSPPFREEDVETGLAYLRQELNAEGYWLAQATLTSRTTDPVTGIVALTIEVHPGVRHPIASAKITSQDGRGMSETKLATDPFAGRFATTGNLNAMRLAVEDVFRSEGYPDAEISMTRTVDERFFIPEFHIDIGKRVRLDHIHIEGLERTKPARIAARMKSLEGDWYDEAAMNKRLRGLLATGAFSSVRVETEDVAPDHIDATLHLDEARAREVTLAAGGDSYQGPILRAAYADRNLLGQLLGFSTGFEFSGRGVLGETKLTDPWVFGSDVSATARVYALIYGREGYTSFETGLEGKAICKFGDHYSLELLAGYALVNLTEDGLPSSELGETVYTQPHLRLTQTLDFRDSPILPTSGWHLETPFEIGAAVGNLSTTYAKAGLTGGWYHQLNSLYQLGLGGEWGVLIPSGGGQDLPIDLRLFNGGARSVRSFQERDLGPSVNGYPTGGEAMWNANAELIRKLGGTLKAVAFVDAGSIARHYDQLGSSDIEIAPGLGLRLDLPIGPVRLEYGYNLTRGPGEPIGTLHFAIGAAF